MDDITLKGSHKQAKAHICFRLSLWCLYRIINVFVGLLLLFEPPCVVSQDDGVQGVSVSQHPMVCFSSGPESDPGFPGRREHWHQTLPGELSCHRPHTRTRTHLDNTEGPLD